jgi:hypothetical protein
LSDQQAVPPITSPVQALRREQLLDALAALLRQGQLPDDPKEAAK